MKGNRNNKKYGYEQQQKQINLVAHDKILVFENFRYLMEGLEEYIEKTDCYPDFKNKRQLRNVTVPKEKNYSLDNCEGLFRTRLLLFSGVLGSNTPDSTRKEVEEEFYKWISIVGIDPNSCSDEKLKHFLLETNNVIKGNSEKIINQTQEYLENNQINLTDPKEMESLIKVFGAVQDPLEKKREEADFYKNKNYFEVEVKDKFDKGNSEQGKRVFNQITSPVSSDDFHFFKKSNPQQKTNSEIIQDVKNNSRNWRIDEVITGYDVFNKPKRENALIHQSAQVGIDGEIFGSLNTQPVYLATKFNQAEITEIKRALNIAEDDENRQIINEVKTNINSWKVETIQGNEWLIHNQAKKVDSEVGHLIHPKQRFTDEEWTEIKNALNSRQSWGSVVSNILPTNFGNAKNYSLTKTTNTTSLQPQKDDKNGIGKLGIVALIGSFVVLVGATIYLVIKPRKVKKISK